MGQGHAKELHSLFKKGKNEEITKLLQKPDFLASDVLSAPLSQKSDGNLAIHFAALCGLDNILRACLNHTEDSHLLDRNNNGQTVLHCVCMKCKHKAHTEESRNATCLQYLLNYKDGKYKTIINQTDAYGMTALHYASQSNWISLCKLLIAAGCEIDVKSVEGMTPYNFALKSENTKLILFLESKLVSKDNYIDEDDKKILNTSDIKIESVAKDELLNERNEMIKELMNALGIDESTALSVLEDHNFNIPEILTQFADQTLKMPEGQEESFQYLNDKETCKICFSEVDADKIVVLSCGHYFCEECWNGYLTSQINDGQIKIKCMENKCNNVITKDIIERLVSKELYKKYDNFCINNYIETTKDMFFCPFPDCNSIVKINKNNYNNNDNNFYSNNNNNNNNMDIPFIEYDLECSKKHRFCGKCNKNPHIPCSCEQWDDWKIKTLQNIPSEIINNNKELLSNPDEAINQLWINENTKLCPKCHTPIEKNEGCNHMTCKHCKHEFCWLCLEKWSIHGSDTGGYYKCNRYEQQNAANNEIDEQKKKIRLTYYLGRFQNHQKSLQQEREFLDSDIEKHIEKIESVSGKKIDISVIKEVLQELIKTREILRNSFVYEFYNDEIKEKKLIFEEYLESLQSITEQLSDAVARDHWSVPISTMVELAAKAKRKRIDFLQTIKNGILPDYIIQEMRNNGNNNNNNNNNPVIHHHHHRHRHNQHNQLHPERRGAIFLDDTNNNNNNNNNRIFLPPNDDDDDDDSDNNNAINNHRERRPSFGEYYGEIGFPSIHYVRSREDLSSMIAREDINTASNRRTRRGRDNSTTGAAANNNNNNNKINNRKPTPYAGLNDSRDELNRILPHLHEEMEERRRRRENVRMVNNNDAIQEPPPPPPPPPS